MNGHYIMVSKTFNIGVINSIIYLNSFSIFH